MDTVGTDAYSSSVAKCPIHSLSYFGYWKGGGGTVGTEEILWVLRRDSGY